MPFFLLCSIRNHNQRSVLPNALGDLTRVVKFFNFLFQATHDPAASSVDATNIFPQLFSDLLAGIPLHHRAPKRGPRLGVEFRLNLASRPMEYATLVLGVKLL